MTKKKAPEAEPVIETVTGPNGAQVEPVAVPTEWVEKSVSEREDEIATIKALLTSAHGKLKGVPGNRAGSALLKLGEVLGALR